MLVLGLVPGWLYLWWVVVYVVGGCICGGWLSMWWVVVFVVGGCLCGG